MAKALTKRGKRRKAGRTGHRDVWTLGGFSGRAILMSVVILLVLSYLSVIINPAKAWFFSIFGLLFIPLLLIDIVLIVWAAKHRSRTTFLAVAVLIPAFFFIGEQVRLPSNRRPVEVVDSVSTLRVVSYNVGRFNQDSDENFAGTWKECADSVMALLEAQDADIICLQEVSLPAVAVPELWLPRHLKGYNVEYFFYGKGQKYGNVTFSRMEAKDKGVIKFENSRNLALYTDYEAGDGLFRVYNCHFESYGISLSGVMKALAGIGKSKGQSAIKDTAYKVKRGIKQRPQQVNQVFDHISNSPVEAIVCGDFNDTPMSYTYHKLSRKRHDTFCEAGEGFGATFAPFWPLVRIDYVLFPEKFSALSHVTPRKPFSDHYPVVTTLRVNH